MLTADFKDALAEVGAMLARAENVQPVLARIGASEVENARARIQATKGTPWGDSWEPWAPSTREHRERKGNAGQGLLWDDGDLLKSIRYETLLNVENLSVVDIGSDLPYAGFLQDGTENMPARKYLGWNDATFPVYEQLLLGWIALGDERALL